GGLNLQNTPTLKSDMVYAEFKYSRSIVFRVFKPVYPWGIYRHECTCIIDSGEVHVLRFRSSTWEHVSYSVPEERSCHISFVEGTSDRASPAGSDRFFLVSRPGCP
ncbi:hypothetical protein PIB30_087034, partial [Stylosanthes scabra]|nr:hypothetical protein [Stylosanthes scabra]